MKAISGDWFASSAIRLCFVDTVSEFRCIRCVSQIRFHDSVSRFPPSGPAGCRSPSSTVLSRHYDFPPFVSRHFVAFVRRYHVIALVLSLSRGKCIRVSLELVTRYLRPGLYPWKRQDLPSSWATPIVRLHMLFDSGETVAPDRVTLDASYFSEQPHGPC